MQAWEVKASQQEPWHPRQYIAVLPRHMLRRIKGALWTKISASVELRVN
jgi:hypothetical protein